MKKTILTIVIAGVLSSPAYALDAESTQQYCEDVKNAGKTAMERYVQQHTPKQAPSNIFNDSVQSCIDNITSMGVGISIPSLGNIAGMLQDLAKKAMEKACQAATDQFDDAVNDALGSVNDRFDDFNNSTGMDVGVGTNGQGGVSVGSAGSVSDVIGNEGNQQINNNLNFD